MECQLVPVAGLGPYTAGTAEYKAQSFLRMQGRSGMCKSAQKHKLDNPTQVIHTALTVTLTQRSMCNN